MENHGIHTQSGNERAVSSVSVCRMVSGHNPEETIDRVVSEQPITVMIHKVGSFTIVATPSDLEALAVGFVYSEGMIDGMDDVIDISTNPGLPDVVGIQVHDPTRISVQRNMIVASSCGLCGVRNIDKMLSEMPGCGGAFAVEKSAIVKAMEHLKARQEVFRMTGGSHAAGIFTPTGEIIHFAEDIGRHSAFDKAIGKCLMAGQTAKGCGAVLSGRISLELLTKAARAGIELVAAVSAPSSFAIKAAQKWNITLCGFVRPERMNIYTYPERICDLNSESQKQ